MTNKKDQQYLMQEITQCTFGQAWKETEAFNTEHAEIVHSRHTVDANKSNISSYVQYNKFKVSSTTFKDSMDFENFCRIFDITPNTLLKTLANGKIKMDKLWNFIFDNVNGLCFCISVFDMSSKAHVYSKKKLNENEKQIIDFHFGRHFLFLIPVVNNVTIPDNEEIENLLQNREIKYSNIFESAGKILINYEEELECSKICKFLPNLFEIVEKFKLICVSISILKNDEEEKLNVEPEILTILAAKKLFHIIEKKFPNEVDFHQNYDNLQTTVSEDELLVLSQNIVTKLEVVKKCLNDKNPPRIVKEIYLDLKIFHNRFLNVIYENPSTTITINSETFEILQEVCEGFLATPFVKHDGSWVLIVDDKNAEVVNSFTTNKYCIVFNAVTKKYLKQLYSDTNDDYYHVITTKQKMKNFQEPMLYALDNNLYPIGTVDNDRNAGETTATKLHVSECNCKGLKKNKKVWMCVACKRFLFETLENSEWLKCNCGFHIISELDKRCVCCSAKRKISRVVPITMNRFSTATRLNSTNLNHHHQEIAYHEALMNVLKGANITQLPETEVQLESPKQQNFNYYQQQQLQQQAQSDISRSLSSPASESTMRSKDYTDAPGELDMLIGFFLMNSVCIVFFLMFGMCVICSCMRRKPNFMKSEKETSAPPPSKRRLLSPKSVSPKPSTNSAPLIPLPITNPTFKPTFKAMISKAMKNEDFQKMVKTGNSPNVVEQRRCSVTSPIFNETTHLLSRRASERPVKEETQIDIETQNNGLRCHSVTRQVQIQIEPTDIPSDKEITPIENTPPPLTSPVICPTCHPTSPPEADHVCDCNCENEAPSVEIIDETEEEEATSASVIRQNLLGPLSFDDLYYT